MWLTVLDYVSELGWSAEMWLTVSEYAIEQEGSAGDVANSFRVCNWAGRKCWGCD